MAEARSFVRRAARAVDQMTRSWPVVHAASLRYGTGEVAKVGGDSLARRTDEHGNIAPYEPDDPEVCRRLFGVEVEV